MNAAQVIYDETNKQNIQVDYLIKNAGFGDIGMFAENDWNKELQMINLNITTLTLFTKLYLQDIHRKSLSLQNPLLLINAGPANVAGNKQDYGLPVAESFGNSWHSLF